MRSTRYVPDAGEIVWMNFTPQAGHEQSRQGSSAGSGARFESGGVQRQDDFESGCQTQRPRLGGVIDRSAKIRALIG